MKKYLMYLSMAVLAFSMVLMSSCSDDDGGDAPVVEPSLIKSIAIDYSGGKGDEVEKWEFIYDANDRVESINNYWNGDLDDVITYNYSVAGKLTITKSGNPTVYTLDSEGRVTKELWNEAGTEYQGYQYNADGRMIKVIEHYDGTDHLKYDLTIVNGNVTNRIRYEDNGVTVREDREFSYTIGDNLSGIHQIYQIDSEWKNVGGTFGEQSKKLVGSYVRHVTDDPTSSFGATYTYTFDAKNRVATQTKNGTSSGGPFSEAWEYTYYED
jgi:hypothetical protein